MLLYVHLLSGVLAIYQHLPTHLVFKHLAVSILEDGYRRQLCHNFLLVLLLTSTDA